MLLRLALLLLPISLAAQPAHEYPKHFVFDCMHDSLEVELDSCCDYVALAISSLKKAPDQSVDRFESSGGGLVLGYADEFGDIRALITRDFGCGGQTQFFFIWENDQLMYVEEHQVTYPNDFGGSPKSTWTIAITRACYSEGELESLQYGDSCEVTVPESVRRKVEEYYAYAWDLALASLNKD